MVNMVGGSLLQGRGAMRPSVRVRSAAAMTKRPARRNDDLEPQKHITGARRRAKLRRQHRRPITVL